MSASNFRPCLTFTKRQEGGWSDHKNDPGGATMMGITLATYSGYLGRQATKTELRGIPEDHVVTIYRKLYWNVVKGDHLPDGFDLVAFDGGVNSGNSRGARWLQQGLGIRADGVIGPITLAASMHVTNGVEVIQKACAKRLGFVQSLRTWSVFGRGWGRRIAEVEAEAVAMHTRNVQTVAVEANRADRTATQQSQGAVGTAGGGGAVTMTDIEPLVLWGLLGVGALVLVHLLRKSRINRERARAYNRKLQEMTNG